MLSQLSSEIYSIPGVVIGIEALPALTGGYPDNDGLGREAGLVRCWTPVEGLGGFRELRTTNWLDPDEVIVGFVSIDAEGEKHRLPVKSNQRCTTYAAGEWSR
jgi:hypothetical protein